MLAGDLLGRHVVRRTETEAVLGEAAHALLAPGERDAEVGQHGAPVVEEHVVRLDVAVDHALAVGVVEPFRDLARDPDRIADRELGLALEPFPERFALHVGHDEEDRVLDPAGIVQRQDVGMLQVGGGLDLLEEPLGADAAREVVVHDLDRDLAIVAGVVREEDLGHAPGADLALERVAVGQCFLQAIEAGSHCS